MGYQIIRVTEANANAGIRRGGTHTIVFLHIMTLLTQRDSTNAKYSEVFIISFLI